MDDELPHVLCVDDEPMILDVLTENLRRSFVVTAATSGIAALEILQADPRRFAVVLSDMRMPGMDGATFLSRARETAPEAVRMLFTGQTDIDTAVTAINDGQIFRFLIKPCPRDMLRNAFMAAAEQHRLLTAERVLLEETLRGSIQALTDVLALSNPAAFGRATRASEHVGQLARKLGISDPWETEIAAMLSQIGSVTLPQETAERLYLGQPLTKDELAMVDRLPRTSEKILRNIPRLDGVRRIIADQRKAYVREATTGGAAKSDTIPIGARMLRIALDFDELVTQGVAVPLAIGVMRGRTDSYDPELLEAFAALLGTGKEDEIREMLLCDLEVGMIFAEDVKSIGDVLLIPRGYHVTPGLLERVANLQPGYAREPVRVIVSAARERDELAA
jgi:response regulator RpfG family c-di-GMP phosphodiesterase